MTNADATGVQQIEFPQYAQGNNTGQPLLVQNQALLDSIKVRLSVVVGQVDTTLGALMALKESTILKTDRLLDQTLDIVVNGEVVARGELVAVGEHFGVQVTQIASLRA